MATLSCSVPAGAAAATLRHAAGGPAWVLAAVRETGHLREVAAGAGFRLKRVRPTRPPPPRLGHPRRPRRRTARSGTRPRDGSLLPSRRVPPGPVLGRRSRGRGPAPPGPQEREEGGPVCRCGPRIGARELGAPLRVRGKARRPRARRPARRPHQPVGRSRQKGGAHRRAREPFTDRGPRKRREEGDLGDERDHAGRPQPARGLRPGEGAAAGRAGVGTGRAGAAAGPKRAAFWRKTATSCRKTAIFWRKNSRGRAQKSDRTQRREGQGAKSRQPRDKMRTTGGGKPRRPGGKGRPPGGKTPRPGSK